MWGRLGIEQNNIIIKYCKSAKAATKKTGGAKLTITFALQ